MSEVHNGTLLQHCDQRPRESVSPYIPELRKLSVDCNFVTRDPTPPLFANSIMLPSVLWCGPISRSLSSRSKISLSKLHVIWPRLHARRGRRCDRFPPGVGLSFPLCDLQRLLIARAHRESLSADEARDDWPLRRSQQRRKPRTTSTASHPRRLKRALRPRSLCSDLYDMNAIFPSNLYGHCLRTR